jgi:pyrroline-5-carboxylate reductase
MKIGFIGAGNMASAIIGGLVRQGMSAQSIYVSDPNKDSLQALQTQFGIHICSDNDSIIEQADTVVLAVKPQILKQVVTPLAKLVQAQQPLVISIAAGLESQTISSWLGGNVAMVRCMPNTPALVQTGASGLFANDLVNQAQRQFSEQLFNAIGVSVWVEHEQLLHAVTAVSGSGPAYYFMFMQAMQEAAQKQGLSKQAATLLTQQTALGAAKMIIQTGEDAEQLRKKVTSPGGTTEQAVLSFERYNLMQTVGKAMQVCADKSVDLAKKLAD